MILTFKSPQECGDMVSRLNTLAKADDAPHAYRAFTVREGSRWAIEKFMAGPPTSDGPGRHVHLGFV